MEDEQGFDKVTLLVLVASYDDIFWSSAAHLGGASSSWAVGEGLVRGGGAYGQNE